MGHVRPAGHSFPLSGVSRLKRPHQLVLSAVLLHSDAACSPAVTAVFKTRGASVKQIICSLAATRVCRWPSCRQSHQSGWWRRGIKIDASPEAGSGRKWEGFSLKGLNPNCWVVGFDDGAPPSPRLSFEFLDCTHKNTIRSSCKKIIIIISQQVSYGCRKLLFTLTHTQPTRLSALPL